MNTYTQVLDRRSDMTDWLIHFTRNVKHGLDARQALYTILLEGVLRPSFSERNNRNTIHGLVPAICFSEQPIRSFIRTLEARTNRSSIAGYGLLIHKQGIFDAGGLPVLYGLANVQIVSYPHEKYVPGYRIIDPDILPATLQYRYVAFNPDPNSRSFVDWTHEREWRWAAKKQDQSETPFPWYPLELFHLGASGPNDSYIHPVHVFVEKDADVEWLQNELLNGVIESLEEPASTNTAIEVYYQSNFPPYLRGMFRTRIISLESTEQHARFEDVPDYEKHNLIRDQDVKRFPEWCHRYLK